MANDIILTEEAKKVQNFGLKVSELAKGNYQKDGFLAPVILAIDKGGNFYTLPLQLKNKELERQAVRSFLSQLDLDITAFISEAWVAQVDYDTPEGKQKYEQCNEAGVASLPDKQEALIVTVESKNCECVIQVAIENRKLGKQTVNINDGKKSHTSFWTNGVWH